jgi:hypothetical protein
MKDEKTLLEEISGKLKGQELDPKKVSPMEEKAKASQSSEQDFSHQVLEALFSN